MENEKAWYLSKTIQGNAVVLVGLVIEWLHLPILNDEANTVIGAIFAVAGVIYAIYGRVKANSKITK